MASVKFEKGSVEWQMFMEYWAMCQELWLPNESDEYWELVVKKTNDFYKKYNTLFARKLALSLVDCLESRMKEGVVT